MKPHRERSSVWHVIVTLVAIYYLYLISKALVLALNPPGGINHTETMGTAVQTMGMALELVVIFVWCFLIRDLLRQIIRFFPKRSS